jgi:hypothetical protein
MLDLEVGLNSAAIIKFEILKLQFNEKIDTWIQNV